MEDSGDHAAASPTATPADRVDQYNALVAEAGTTLKDQLARIRKDYDSHEIDVREAADERIQVMTEHLTRLRLLREEYLRS